MDMNNFMKEMRTRLAQLSKKFAVVSARGVEKDFFFLGGKPKSVFPEKVELFK